MAAALIALGACDAHALSMGKVRVQSALGQSLTAEIDLSDLSEEDAKTLKPSLASPSAFSGIGLEYNPALNGTQIELQRRPNGSRFLKLVNSRPLNDPFVDIVVELSWASGRIVRTYTILLDPQKPQETTSAPVLPSPAIEAPASITATLVAPAAGVAAKPAPAAAAMPVPIINSPPTTGTERKRVRVRSGDTAGRIARSMAPEGVSVEQMLVAILNTNPTAFAGRNVNRLRADAELLAPDEALVRKTSQAEARQIIDGQNQDFQAMRRGIASQAPKAPAPSKPAGATGAVNKPTPPNAPKATPSDTLKLSKGAVQDKADKAGMEQIAQERAKTEASDRAKELAKNIEELNQLAKVAAKPELPAAPAASTAAADGSNVPAGSASAPSKVVGPAVASGLSTAPAPSWDNLIETAVQDPRISGTLLALVGLLLGFGWFRRRQSVPATNPGRGKWDSAANTSFDTGGGGRVDTADIDAAALTSHVYADSQLEVSHELDPVAEAEVYLAYGKDVPAEEILKEGLQQDPTRVAIHLKLLGIFAKRGDAKNFESMARDVKVLVQASGTDWAHVQEMGHALDPSNPLYGASTALSAAEVPLTAAAFQHSMLSLDADALEALSSASSAPELAAQKPPTSTKAPSFDLSSIDLEPSPSGQSAPIASTDRLEATLALAEQFLEIGEKEGGRALLEEVLAGGNDGLRQRATRLLAKAG